MPANNTGTWDNNAIKFPQLLQQIVETPMDAFDWRTLLQYHKSDTNRVVVPIEKGCSTAVVDRVGEGAEIPMNFSPIEGQEIVTYKIGRGFMVTHEMSQYEQIPVIDQRKKRLNWELYNTCYTDIAFAIGAAVPPAHIIAATGTSLGNDGTEFTIPNTIGQYDLINGLRLLEEAYKGLSNSIVLMVNPVGLQQIRRLPHYSSVNQYGEQSYMNGKRGSVEGCQLIVSNLVPDGVAYMIATDPMSWRDTQFTPVGYWVESRPIDVMNRPYQERDSFGVFAVWEYGVGITYSKGIVKLTYTGYS